MESDIRFFTAQDIVDINKTQIREFGGFFGIRDNRLLDSAVANCQATFGGEYMFCTVPDIAACYAHGIIKNHPFVDGNKRTGMATALLFFVKNGYDHGLSNYDIWHIGVGLATSEFSQEEVAKIFAAAAKK
ncbi:MAG TPA: type II toxin-antitoxin system death-on-curing family toxin [Candidatus Bathyarchaeia archaeon]|nr:type II toxin-antitoxin system death-on-curing family toxin [Candidatus Bathyarchaeia archaeon]